MRNFLTDIHIAGVTMAFREGNLIRYCLDDLIKYCDRVVIILDNYDKKTEKIVLEYRDKYKKVTVFYSKVPRLIIEKTGELRKRLNYRQGEIRDQVLRKLEELHKEEKIDLLLWPDGDEIFTKELGERLTTFWNSKIKVLYPKFITLYDSFKIIKQRSIFPHARIFKYRPDMTAIPYRSRTFYRPFERGEAARMPFGIIHLALLTEENRKFRQIYFSTALVRARDDVLWFLDKDAREMSNVEFLRVLRTKPNSTIYEYNEQKELSKRT